MLGLLVVAVGTSLTSCSDFLDEELTTQQNTDYFNTPEGIDALEVSLYYNLRFHFSKEWATATTNYGTDEFRVGGDGSNASWNNYDGIKAAMKTAGFNDQEIDKTVGIAPLPTVTNDGKEGAQ